MSSDNTGDSATVHACNRAPSADNTWLSAIAERCAECRISARPKGRYEDYLSMAFGHPAGDALAFMYTELEMSAEDIRQWLVANLGWCVVNRQIHKILHDHGVSMRGHGEHKRLSWKQGKMDAALAKSRQGSKQAYFIGSTAEKMVRYLLQVTLSALNLPWHVVIGDQLQIILPRYEIDIPVVVVDPTTGRSCRFAVEVDSSYAHDTAEIKAKDQVRDVALESVGWAVYRVDSDSLSPVIIVPQVVDVAVDIKRVAGMAFGCANMDGGKCICS